MGIDSVKDYAVKYALCLLIRVGIDSVKELVVLCHLICSKCVLI